MQTVDHVPTGTKPPGAFSYTAQFTAAQIFGFADLVRRLGSAYGPDVDRPLRQELVDALNEFVQLLPEPSDEDGDAYLAAVRAGDLPNWGMDDLPLTETTEEWAARVRAAQPPSPDAAITRSFPGRPESVSAARAWVAGFLPGSPAAADAALMTSELVTNAVLYSASGLTGGTFTVAVRAGDGCVRVDVTDQGEMPRASAPAGLGKGLVIVSQLADDSGADGACRWFCLRTGCAAVQDPADEPWARTSERNVWRAYRGGLVLTASLAADGSGWLATVESANVTERSPAPLATRTAAQRWADSRAGGAR